MTDEADIMRDELQEIRDRFIAALVPGAVFAAAPTWRDIAALLAEVDKLGAEARILRNDLAEADAELVKG